jgi:gliding motility-associated-like protein
MKTINVFFKSLIITVFSSIILSSSLYSQIVLDASVDPQTLVQDVLLGQGVQVFNITSNAPNQRYGYFNGVNSNIGMPEGITLATKHVGIAACGATNNGSGAGSDPDLSQILGGGLFPPSLNDVTILEFDFIPQGDSISFTFVFASREYDSFVGSSYNDVFGFFLSGPGITGNFSNNAVNIAVLPNGTPITINNVNAGQNSSYYVANGDNLGNNNPNQGNNSYLCFGGYTIPITVGHQVQCGETYHLKMAIANVSDGIRDSQVFLEGGSLSSNFIDIDATTIGDSALTSIYGENTIIQGCTEGLIQFIRPTSDSLLTIHYDLGGTAVNGVHYEEVPDSVVFEIGQDTVEIVIIPTEDYFADGETVEVTIYQINLCGDTTILEVSFTIISMYEVLTDYQDTTLYCPQDIVALSGWYGSGIPPFEVEWFADSDLTQSLGFGDEINVSTNSTETMFYVQVTDFCGTTAVDSILVSFDITYPEVTMLDSEVALCPGDMITIGVEEVTGGLAPYSYSWDVGGTSSSISVNPSETTTYTVTVTDDCGSETTGEITVTVEYDPVVIFLQEQYVIPCPGDPVTLSADAELGTPPYSFEWSNNDNGSETTVSPDDNTTYTVTVTDECGAVAEASTEVVIQTYDPIDAQVKNDTILCPDSELTLYAKASGGAGGYFYQWSYIGGEGIESENGVAVVQIGDLEPGTEVRFAVLIFDQCGDSYYDEVTVEIVPCDIEIPNIITPNGDGINDAFVIKNLQYHTNTILKIFNRWGNLVYETENYDNNWRGTKNNGTGLSEGTYFYILTLTTENEVFEGTVTIRR